MRRSETLHLPSFRGLLRKKTKKKTLQDTKPASVSRSINCLFVAIHEAGIRV